MKILVIGTGAVGCLYGSLAARSGAEVSVLARSDYEVIKSSGIEVRSSSHLGTYQFTPASVLSSIEELKEKPDYVFLCTKVLKEIDRVALLRNALGSQTSIVLISNGVDVEGPIAEAYPDHEIVSGLAYVCVTRMAPGIIWHQDYGRLVLGNFPRGVSERTHKLSETIHASGIECQTHNNIVAVRWEKCLWNAPFNSLSVLSGGLRVNDILGSQESLVRRIMEEVLSVARSLDYEMPDSIIDALIDYSRKMKPYKTSMLVDFEQGRPMEIDAILGSVVRASRRVNISVPTLDVLYELLQLNELSRCQRKTVS